MEQAGPSTGKAVAKPSGKRFEIKKWNAVAMWSWAICTDTCAICRNNLYEPSIEYQVHLYNPSDSHHAVSLLHARMQCLKSLPESAAGIVGTEGVQVSPGRNVTITQVASDTVCDVPDLHKPS